MAKTIRIVRTEARHVQFLRARCGVRYWEDATVNGVEDEDGSRIPCRVGDNWCPVVDLDTGIVRDWPKGTTADIHYKVCDDGDYALLDGEDEEVVAIEGYVPAIMCPDGSGYGDYVIMTIDGDGRISSFDGDNLKAFVADANA